MMPSAFVSSVLPILLGLAACKTNQSQTKDAATDLIKATLPPALVSKIIQKQDIRGYILPADGSNRSPSTMNGVWWTNGKSTHFVVSFKNVAWNDSTRTASILFTGPGTYANVPQDSSAVGTMKDEVFDVSFTGYDIVFDAKGTHANLELASSQFPGEKRVDSDQNFTMDLVADGDWLRKTPGRDDYHIRRIINGDGSLNTTKYHMTINGADMYDTPWAGFLADNGFPLVKVFVPSVKIDDAGGSVNVLLGQQYKQYFIPVGNSNEIVGSIKVSDNFSGKMFIQTTHGGLQGGDGGSKSLQGSFGSNPIIVLQPNAGSGEQTVTVTYTSATHQMSDTTPLHLSLDKQTPTADATVTRSGYANGLYELSTNATFPVILTLDQADAFNRGSVILEAPGVNRRVVRLPYQTKLTVTLPANSDGGSFDVVLRALPKGSVNHRGAIPVGASITATLPTFDAVDLYDLPTAADKASNIEMREPNKSCCFYILAIDGSGDAFRQIYKDYRLESSDVFLRMPYDSDAPKAQLAVFFTGDYNSAQKDLSYSFGFKSFR